MSYTAKEVGPNRFRETIGRFYEDFEVGHIFEHRPGRTITETDNIWFTNLTMNTHPIHFDVAYASKTEFKKPEINKASKYFFLLIISKNIFHLEKNVVVIINIAAVHKHLCTTNSMWPINETYSKYITPIKPHQKEPNEVNSNPLLKSGFIDILMN